MSARDVAFKSIEDFVQELTNGMHAAEQAALRAQPRGGTTVIRVLDDYEDRLRKLADRCSQKFKWVDEQAHVLREWRHADEWRQHCFKALSELHDCENLRINPIISSLGIGSDVLAHALDSLASIHDRTQKKLLADLNTKIEESKSKSRGDGLAFGARLIWLIFGAAIGVLGTLIAK
jgi:predicted transcriptional regulator